MSKIIAAIGGTGQEVALACLRLCHLGEFEIPRIFVFDSDDFDPDTTKGESGTRSQRLRELGRFLSAVNGKMDTVTFQSVVDGDHQNDNVVSLFSTSNVPSPEVKDLLDLLISPQQQSVKITDGFHGEPTVGAIAFADAIGVRAWKAFELKLNEETQLPGEHFVVLTGGTAGGTGPGVLPVLAGEVMNWKRNRRPDLPNVNVSLLVQLPWFRIADRADGDIEFEAMQHNSACLVKQYHNDLDRLGDRVVLLGLPDVVDRKSSGPNRQPETLHYINLVSGWLAAEMLSDSVPRQKMLTSGVYALSFDDDEDPLELTLTGRGDGNVKRLLRVREAIQASSLGRAFCLALAEQCRYPRDISLPVEIWRLAERLGTELDGFRRAIELLGNEEEEVITWFDDVCSDRTHGSNDLPRVFVPHGERELEWITAARRLNLPTRKHNLVGRLMYDANLLGVFSAAPEGVEKSQLGPKSGDEIAALIFSRLKGYLVDKLAERAGTSVA